MIKPEVLIENGLSGSTIDLFQQCKRKYYNSKVRGLKKPGKSIALVFGEMIHDALEHYQKELSEEQVIDRFMDTYGPEYQGEDERRSVDAGIKLLREYFKNFPKEHEPYEYICLEEEFQIDVGAVLPFRGRIDAVVKDKQTGNIYVVEYKTTSMLPANYFDRYELSSAIDGYILYARQKYGRCDGVLVVGLMCSKTKPRVERQIIVRTEEQIKEWLADIRKIAVELKSDLMFLHDEMDSWTRSRGRCYDYMVPCEFFELCMYCENPAVLRNYEEVDSEEARS